MKLFVFNSDERVETARNQIQHAYSKRYTGWDNEFDRQFDHQTIWFVIDDGNDTFGAIARFVFWDRDNAHHRPLSINLADDATWQCYTDIRIQAEATGLIYTNQDNLYALVYAMFTWLDDKGIEICYSIFNPNHERVRNFNEQVLNFQPIADATMKFNNFRSVRDNQSVIWQIASQTEKQRKVCIKNLKGNARDLLSNLHRNLPIPG
jgi:hypothetical protein